MAAPLSPRRPAEDPNRIASKQRFADKGEVRRKWLKEYGSIEEDGNYRHNKECLSELFNLLDFVTDNALQGYLQQSTYLGLRDDGQERWLYHGPEGDRELNFRPPIVYSSRVYALNQFLGSGHLPRGVNKDVRELRNDMTHVNATVMADQYRLDMDSLWQPLYDIGTALFQLGMLDRRDIVPSFDSLRVQPGSELRNGKYEVCELIGEGGMSRVWRGRQQDAYLVRDVAIKELKPDHYVKETIRNECAVMIRLKHSHIPVIYDAFSQNGTYYIVMELIHGETLSSYLRTHRLTAEQRDRIADGLCDVLSYLHSAGQAFVYADLKPDNILIGPTGDPYLIDFGISRTQGGGKSPRYISPKWSAPEVLDGRPADRRADVYALGKVLSEVYQPAADPTLRAVLDVCTAEDPNRRFESVRAVSNALKAARGQSGSYRPPQQIRENPQHPIPQTDQLRGVNPVRRPAEDYPAPQQVWNSENMQKNGQRSKAGVKKTGLVAVIVLALGVVILTAVLIVLLLGNQAKPAEEAASASGNDAAAVSQTDSVSTAAPGTAPVAENHGSTGEQWNGSYELKQNNADIEFTIDQIADNKIVIQYTCFTGEVSLGWTSIPSVTPNYYDGRKVVDAKIYVDGVCYDGKGFGAPKKFTITAGDSGEFYINLDDIEGLASLTIHEVHVNVSNAQDITIPIKSQNR